MTVCKACGGQMSFAYLEKHVCPTPNPEYEKERDKYRQSEVERRARNERLGIKEIPSPPVWVCLEVVLLDRSVLKYAIQRDDFWLENHRLIIEPVTEGGWAERIFRNSIRSYRFREFADEAAARTAAGLSTERV
jgi:hypothetical protein